MSDQIAAQMRNNARNADRIKALIQNNARIAYSQAQAIARNDAVLVQIDGRIAAQAHAFSRIEAAQT
jgi:hypothetical protein